MLGGGEEAALAASFLWHPRASAARGGAPRALPPRALAEALDGRGSTSPREPWRRGGASRRRRGRARARADAPGPRAATSRSRRGSAPLVEALGLALERDECVCALARGSRGRAGDPFALLERAFRSASRSSCRVTIARELSRGGARLPARARESLWDAEPAVVVAALGAVEAADPATEERIASLARDGWPVGRDT